MTLKEYLLQNPYTNIALLWFEGKDLKCEEYTLNEYDKISDNLLDMEFMDCSNEDEYDNECKEIWIR